MSATSFGGSFDLVRTNSSKYRDLIEKHAALNVLHAFLPFLKYIPFAPPMQVKEMRSLLKGILSRRREELANGKEVKRDLLQVSSRNFVCMHNIMRSIIMNKWY